MARKYVWSVDVSTAHYTVKAVVRYKLVQKLDDGFYLVRIRGGSKMRLAPYDCFETEEEARKVAEERAEALVEMLTGNIECLKKPVLMTNG